MAFKRSNDHPELDLILIAVPVADIERKAAAAITGRADYFDRFWHGLPVQKIGQGQPV